MESKNVWQQIFGRKYLGEQILLNDLGGGGGKMGNNYFLKQIFLGENFRDQVLEERFL